MNQLPDRDYLLGGGPMLRIAREVSIQRGVPMVDIFSPRRHAYIAAVRHEIWRRIREETNATYAEIGRYFKRDHSTVFYALERGRPSPVIPALHTL